MTLKLQSGESVCIYLAYMNLLKAVMCALESDGRMDKGPVVALLHPPWVEQHVTEGAAQGTQGVMWRAGGFVHDGLQFGHHPPLSHLLF